MGAQVVDYRVSTIVVLCKDCGQDVGLYPARHKCQDVSRPPLPPLPTQYLDDPRRPTPLLDPRLSSSSSASFGPPPPSPGNADSKWARFGKSNVDENEDDSSYFNKFAENLDETEPSGKKLWGKVRQNEKWKQLNDKNDKAKSNGKIWGKLLQATQTMADKIPSREEDRGPESDGSDWEGESHVSRVLREHYEKKRQPLPNWLRDMRTPPEAQPEIQQPEEKKVNRQSTGRRRLWDTNPEMSRRERERHELRQAGPPKPEEHHHPYQEEEQVNGQDRYGRYRKNEPDARERPGRYDDHHASPPPSPYGYPREKDTYYRTERPAPGNYQDSNNHYYRTPPSPYACEEDDPYGNGRYMRRPPDNIPRRPSRQEPTRYF
ncbi:hypothetical protein DFQ28_001971 [Apophysomyces sp. BC1034]|nr:hypothetical protein DFQ30_002376 [Apophysomyces sp. BC1015]KAG0179910.1 hypothetical protein DFQ29_001490 [Apophysomyces sp. BC1021]KAG0190498.1 hypothetical protein DFQ28_001971 [Apophysomyces sp. BC1034]